MSLKNFQYFSKNFKGFDFALVFYLDVFIFFPEKRFLYKLVIHFYI